ncbi:hypothetical protein Tco_0940258 [Tanacetum coccineum]|uniref:Uncharacterized protein n=1 Tax=Tanacetum coccineum TaxID=301880 RepID=A0ABQ5DQ26_9ASTR
MEGGDESLDSDTCIFRQIQTDAKSIELQKYRDEQEQIQTDTDSDRQQQIQTDSRYQIQTDIIRFKQTIAYSDRQQQIQQIYSATNRQVYSGRQTAYGCRQKEPTQQYLGGKLVLKLFEPTVEFLIWCEDHIESEGLFLVEMLFSSPTLPFAVESKSKNDKYAVEASD